MKTWGPVALAVALLVALVLWIGRGDETPGAATRGPDGLPAEAPAIGTSDAQPPAPGLADRTRRRPAQAAPAATCALTIRVETTAGAPVEGCYVGVDDRSAYTDSSGRAALGAVRRGAPCSVTLEFESNTRQESEREVEIPADASEHEAVLRVDPPLWPVLVVRIVSDAPREASASLSCSGGASLFFNDFPARQSVVRVPIAPPRAGSIRVSLQCPGFLDAETDVETPRVPGDHPVVLTLRSGGLPARGRVFEADGAPAAGAKVLVCRERTLTSAVSEVNQVITDADGRFAIDNSMRGLTIVALREGKSCSGWLRLTNDVHAVDLHLGPGAAVQGTVTDDEGAPAAGTEIRILFNPRGLDISHWKGTADAPGYYRVDGIPEGCWFRPTLMWSARFRPADGSTDPYEKVDPDEAVRRGEAHVAGPPGDLFRCDLRAKRYESSATYEIRLRFPEDAEIPERVVVETSFASGSSSGEVAIDPAAPVVTQSIGFGRRTLVSVRAGRWQADTGWLVPEEGTERHEIVLDMKQGPRIVAQLVDGAGAPVHRGGVVILVGHWRARGGSGGPSATTGDDGRADVTASVQSVALLDDPRWAVVFAMCGPGVLQRGVLGEHPNLRIAGPDLAQRLRGARDEIVLPIPVVSPRRFVVRTVDETRHPVAGVTLHAGDRDILEPDTVTTGADGRAEISLLVDAGERATEEAKLSAQPPFVGDSDRRIELFETESDEPWTVEVQRLVRQRVRIFDDEGAPVAGVQLNSDEDCVTNADGETVVLLPAAGGSIELDGYESPLVVPATDGATVRVQVAALRDVTLNLTVPDGAPEEYEATITRSGAGVIGRPGVVVRGKPPVATTLPLTRAVHSVELLSEDHLWSARFDVPAGAASVTAAIERRPLRTVRIRFVDAAGAPLAHTRVSFAVIGPPSFEPREDSTDGAGEFRLDLPDGTYGLQHAGPGGPLSELQQFTVPADALVVVRM